MILMSDENVHVGDHVWGCAFELSKKKFKVKQDMKPTYGVITDQDFNTKCDSQKPYTGMYELRFVPLDEDGNLRFHRWKIVDLTASVYETKERAEAIYKEMILKEISRLLFKGQRILDTYIQDGPDVSGWWEQVYDDLTKRICSTTPAAYSNNDGLAEFTVGFAVDGRYYAHVRAKDPDEAKSRANDAFMDADFGELECIDSKPINCEDDAGNVTDYD